MTTSFSAQAKYLPLYQLRKKEQGEDYGYILTHKTPEGRDWWQEVFEGKEPRIPAASIEDLRKAGMMPEPSITLEDYARMEREEEAITSPSHYKVCEGLDVVDMIRAVLTPEQFSGYCLGNVIKYRMRAGKKTMSPMEDLGKAHVYEEWLRELEGGEG
jgi:hypothetical protein